MEERLSELRLVYSDSEGSIADHPTLTPLGGTFGAIRSLGQLIPLPDGATLCMLPGCTPVGGGVDGEHVSMEAGKDVAVGALLPTGYSRLFLPAYVKVAGAPYLPLFGYTAIAARDGKIYAAAMTLDPAESWKPSNFHSSDLAKHVQTLQNTYPDNRLYGQLSTCALDYGCYTAQNVFYERWEAAIPVSPKCAARCVGCISEQEDGEVPSPQIRLDFAPTPEEISELAVHHFASGGHMISFGQGCEGDPLNRARPLSEAIRLIREKTACGIINVNTNGWNPRGLDQLCKAGLNRIRVSLFSATPEGYDGYYRPRGYSIEQVERSMKIAHAAGLTVAINLLVFPGYIDCEGETEALISLLERTGVHEIQLRTLNIDTEMLRDKVPAPSGLERGLATFIQTLRKRLPHVTLASHSNAESPATVGH